MATKKSNEVQVELKKFEPKYATITIVGDTPLIQHKWDEKAKQMILDTQMKKAKKAYETKRPFADCIRSLYWISGDPEITDDMTDDQCAQAFNNAIHNGAKFGFPSVAIKQAIASAAYRNGLTKDKVSILASFYIEGELIEIVGEPEIREDMVRVGMGAADIRFRGEFKKWHSVFNIRYIETAISLEQLINFIELAGFSCGIGEWRPEKRGQNGMFHISDGTEFKYDRIRLA